MKTLGDNLNLVSENDVDLFELVLDAGDQLIADIDGQTNPLTNIDFIPPIDGGFPPPEFSDTYYVEVSSFDNFNYDPLTEGSGSGFSSGFYDLFLTINDPGEDTEFDLEVNFNEPDVSGTFANWRSEDTEYDLEVNFIDDSLTPSQQAIFEDAAERWEEIIIGDVRNVFVLGFGPVDDIVIDASAPFIDGPGGNLGQAGPTVVRSDSFLPARGIMEFDSADVADLEEEGQLDEVILHEMGHVLGFGTIWRALDLLTGVGSADPRFVGAGATAEYNDIFGVSESGVPVEAEGGLGTALGHWDEEVLDNELMTGFINSGVANPLSRITAASMGDLGYEVNVDAADAYTPPVIGDSSLELVG